MSFEYVSAVCKTGDLSELLRLLAEENDPLERECFYVGTFNMTHRDHPQTAIALGRRYLEEFYQSPEPFGAGRLPRGDVLKRLVLLFDPYQYEDDEEYQGNRELAIWVCKFALAFGVSDGTKMGFQGRLENLERTTT